MFVVLAGDSGRELKEDIAAIGAALRGSSVSPARTWVDSAAGFAVAGISRGILPEDVFDTQPYITPELCFVADGRIDNRAEVADRLSLSSTERAEVSDAALLHLAYRRWGEDAGNVLAGQYSFCAIHRDTRRVVVASDHIGSSCVMYATVHGRLLVANQAGAMLAHPLLRNAPVDMDATAVLVASRSTLGRTAFREIRTVRGGHTLRWSAAGGATEHRWWHPERAASIRYRDPAEYVEHANALFAQAVRGCLRAVGPISATLSGGLDSSLVAGVAAVQLAQGSGAPLALYTSVPEPGLPCMERPGWDASEADLVQAFAPMHPNTTHTLVSAGSTSTLDVMRETHALSHTPVRNTANQVWLRAVCRSAAGRGSRVVLVGERGNATVSLDGSLLAGSLLSQNPRLALRLMQVDHKNGGRPIWRPLLRQLLDALHLQKRPVPYGQQWLQAATVYRLGDLLKPDLKPLRTRGGQVLFATVPQRTWSSDVFAHHGVEYRDPTADKRIIEMTVAFPVEAFFAGGRSRGLAREMSRGVVPDVIRLRRRRGAQVPELCALIARDGAAYGAALRSLHDSPACRENFQLDRAEAALEALCSGEQQLAAAATLDRLVDVGLFWKEHGL